MLKCRYIIDLTQENIHTPTTEGISLKGPPSSPDFPFLTGRRYGDRRFIKWARFCRDSQELLAATCGALALEYCKPQELLCV